MEVLRFVTSARRNSAIRCYFVIIFFPFTMLTPFPLGKDTLVCFSDGKKRGYFSKNTGKVIIEPKYVHAWVFSDGLASVEEDGYIKFFDEGSGNAKRSK